MVESISRGGIVYVKLEGTGSRQSGYRPVLVISNNMCNKHSPVISVVPLTSKSSKKPIPTHKTIEKGIGNLKVTSIALCEALTSLCKDSVMEKIGTVDTYTLAQINQGVMCQLGIC